MEAKYHKGCYRRYTAAESSSKSTAGHKSIQAEYDSAFLKLINEIEQKLVKEGSAYDMVTLSGMYKRHLIDYYILEWRNPWLTRFTYFLFIKLCLLINY